MLTAGKAKASQPAILAALPKGVGIVFVILNLSKICKKKKKRNNHYTSTVKSSSDPLFD